MNCIGRPAMGVRTEKYFLLPNESNGLKHLEAGSCVAIPARFHNTKNIKRYGCRTKDCIVVFLSPH